MKAKTLTILALLTMSVVLSHGQTLTQSIALPMQGKMIKFNPQNSGEIISYSSLPIPNPSDYPWLSVENLNSFNKAKYVEKVVTNEKGELLFFIKDHRIYDHRGVSGCMFDSPYIFTGQGGGSDVSSESPFIRKLEVIPLDGYCYKYLIVWHEVAEGQPSAVGALSGYYYSILYVGSDKTLSFEEGMTSPYHANLFYEDLDDLGEDGSPSGFAVSKVNRSLKPSRFLFLHCQGFEHTFQITHTGLNPNPIHSSYYANYPITGIEDRMFWDENEVIKKGDNYYYVFASGGSHPAKIALVFIKYNSMGQKIFQTYKDVGYTYYSGQDVNQFIKGMEFSEDGSYLYFTQKGKPLQYLATDFMENETNPGEVKTVSPLTTDYQYSYIELGRDKRFYLINENGGTLTAISNTNLPNNLVITPNIGLFEGIHHLEINSDYSIVSNTNTDRWKNYYISSQIDGSDYTSYYTNLPQNCCSEHFYYHDDYMTNDPAPMGLTETWTPNSNPFNTNGSSEVYLRENLLLHKNTRISIMNMTFYFKEGKGIILESGVGSIKGARLTLNNTKCTAYDGCGENNNLWKGIVANGNASSESNSSYTQTQVIIKNNSTIEFAQIGVHSLKGATVQAIGSNFFNNKCGIYYDFFQSPKLHNSYVTDCKFITDNVLYQNKHTNPLYFVKLKYYPVNFTGNIMKNIADNSVIGSVYNRGLGIKATNSRVHIKPKTDMLGMILQKSIFYKLRHAVVFEGFKSSESFANNCIFDHNLDAFKVRWGADNCIITKNEFKNIYSNDPNYYNESGGLFLEGVTGYVVEENEFHDGVAGLFIVNSGREYNQIYKNRFYNMQNNSNYTAIVATQQNAEEAYEHSDGLDFICNKFENNDFAIAVIDGSVSKIQNGQKGNILNIGPAGNWFDHCHLLPGNTDFYTENTTIDAYTYVQHSKRGTPNELKLDQDLSTHIGDYYDWNLIHINNDELANNNYNEYCPARNFTINLNIGMELADNEKLSENIKVEELSILDLQANNEIMSAKVNTATNTNFSEVSEELSSNNGYLKEEVLVDYMLKDIDMPIEKTVALLANSPLPSKAKKNLEQSNLPQNYIDYITLHQKGLNPREAKEQQISMHKAYYQQLVNQMIFKVANDTIGNKKDSLITWLGNKNDRFSKEKLIQILTNSSRFEEAIQTIEDFKNDFSIEHPEQWSLMRKLGVLSVKNSDEFLLLVKNNQSELEAMASVDYGKENTLARGYLNLAGLGEFKEKYPLPNTQRKACLSKQNIKSSISPQANEATISIYPNPANTEVKVVFFSITGSKTLKVYNLKGQLVKQIPTEKTYGFITINVSDISNGIYLISPDNFKNATKLIVQH